MPPFSTPNYVTNTQNTYIRIKISLGAEMIMNLLLYVVSYLFLWSVNCFKCWSWIESPFKKSILNKFRMGIMFYKVSNDRCFIYLNSVGESVINMMEINRTLNSVFFFKQLLRAVHLGCWAIWRFSIFFSVATNIFYEQVFLTRNWRNVLFLL